MSIRTEFLAVVVLGMSAMAAPSYAVNPDQLNLITFENRTGASINYIFLSPSDSQYWGTDILGSSRVLGDDEGLGFYIHYPNRCDEFDIYAVGANDEAFLVYGYELCDGKAANVKLTRRNLDAAPPDFDFTTVTLQNDTGYELWYLFFSPSDSAMWGVDQLDKSTILYPGQELSVLLPVRKQSVRYDVQAVDEDEDTYTFFVEIDPKRSEHSYSIDLGDLD